MTEYSRDYVKLLCPARKKENCGQKEGEKAALQRAEIGPKKQAASPEPPWEAELAAFRLGESRPVRLAVWVGLKG